VSGEISDKCRECNTISFEEDITDGITEDIEIVAYLMDAGSVDVSELSERIGIVEQKQELYCSFHKP